MKHLATKTALVLLFLMGTLSASASELFLKSGEDATIRASDTTHVYCDAGSIEDRCDAEEAQIAINIFRDCRNKKSAQTCAVLIKKKLPRGALCSPYRSVCFDSCRGDFSVETCVEACY